MSSAFIRTASLAATLALAVCCRAQQLEAPVRLTCEGQPITVSVGHAAPYLYDFDGDGVRDLLVGQFGNGEMQVFRNKGTDKAPVYEKPKVFEAGGATATVPAG